MAAVIRVRDQKTRKWGYLSGETLAKSAIASNIDKISFLATIEAFIKATPSDKQRKAAFLQEALHTYETDTASRAVIKNESPKEGN